MSVFPGIKAFRRIPACGRVRMIWLLAHRFSSAGELIDEQLETLRVVARAESAGTAKGDQSVQRGPQHLGERVRILLVSDEADRLSQLGEGRRQLRGCVLGGEAQGGRAGEHRVVNGRVVAG